MTGKKITDLTQATQISDTDLLLLVEDVDTVPTSKKVTLSQILPDSTTSIKGRIRLNKDLGGTANNPLVVGLQGTPVSAEVPNDGEGLLYVSSAGEYQPTIIPIFKTEAIREFIEVPSVKSYVLDIRAPYEYVIDSISAQCRVGGCSISITIDGTTIGGLSDVNIGNAVVSTYLATTNKTVSVNSKVSLIVESLSSAQDLSIVVKVVRS